MDKFVDNPLEELKKADNETLHENFHVHLENLCEAKVEAETFAEVGMMSKTMAMAYSGFISDHEELVGGIVDEMKRRGMKCGAFQVWNELKAELDKERHRSDEARVAHMMGQLLNRLANGQGGLH